jgi:hypothetical protein
MIAWSALDGYIGANVSELTYDVLDDDGMRRCFRSLRRTLPARLSRAQSLLKACGSPHVESFDPRRAAEIVRYVRRQRKLFYGLLKAESLLIDNFVRLGIEMREYRYSVQKNPEFVSKQLFRAAADFSHSLTSRLKRFYDRTSFASVGSLIIGRAEAGLLKAVAHPL